MLIYTTTKPTYWMYNTSFKEFICVFDENYQQSFLKLLLLLPAKVMVYIVKPVYIDCLGGQTDVSTKKSFWKFNIYCETKYLTKIVLALKPKEKNKKVRKLFREIPIVGWASVDTVLDNSRFNL